MNPHRTITMGDGRRRYQRYIGSDLTLRDSDRPEVWETVEVDAQGNPYAYQASADIHFGVSADGVFLMTIAGRTYGIPDEQLDDLDAGIALVREDSRAKRREIARDVPPTQ